MINDSYYFEATHNNTLFAFESKGVKGKILKIVLFEMTDNGK